MFAGAMSGLTVGLMSFSVVELENKIICGSDQEVKSARKILPIVSRHHLLLVTLLLGNTIAMETLPIMLEMMVGGGGAILISVPMLMIFGEVLPQAFCTGPDKLYIASRLVSVVKVVTFLLYPVSYPISIFLDGLLGKGEELSHLKDINELDVVESVINKSNIETEDGVEEIDIETQTIEGFIKPISSVYRLSVNAILSKSLLRNISDKKQSKIPIYSENEKSIIGILKTSDLLGLDDDISIKNSGIRLEKPLFIKINSSILTALSFMHEHKTQIAIIISAFKSDETKALGIITLSDIIDILYTYKLVNDGLYDRKYIQVSTSSPNQDNNLISKNLEKSSKSFFYHKNLKV